MLEHFFLDVKRGKFSNKLENYLHISVKSLNTTTFIKTFLNELNVIQTSYAIKIDWQCSIDKFILKVKILNL